MCIIPVLRAMRVDGRPARRRQGWLGTDERPSIVGVGDLRVKEDRKPSARGTGGRSIEARDDRWTLLASELCALPRQEGAGDRLRHMPDPEAHAANAGPHAPRVSVPAHVRPCLARREPQVTDPHASRRIAREGWPADTRRRPPTTARGELSAERVCRAVLVLEARPRRPIPVTRRRRSRSRDHRRCARRVFLPGPDSSGSQRRSRRLV